jgi:hypothetical protein
VSVSGDAEEDSLLPVHEISHPICSGKDPGAQHMKTVKKNPGKEKQSQDYIFYSYKIQCSL